MGRAARKATRAKKRGGQRRKAQTRGRGAGDEERGGGVSVPPTPAKVRPREVLQRFDRSAFFASINARNSGDDSKVLRCASVIDAYAVPLKQPNEPKERLGAVILSAHNAHVPRAQPSEASRVHPFNTSK